MLLDVLPREGARLTGKSSLTGTMTDAFLKRLRCQDLLTGSDLRLFATR